MPLELLTETVQKVDSKITTEEVVAMLRKLETKDILMYRDGVAHRMNPK